MHFPVLSSMFVMGGTNHRRIVTEIVQCSNIDLDPDPPNKDGIWKNDDGNKNRLWENSTRQFAAMHLIGYCFRQRLYSELLNYSRIIDTIQHHPTDIGCLIVLPALLMLFVGDSYKKRSFEKLRGLYLNSAVQLTRIGEIMILVVFIVFTKDIENVL
jgi:hypothetical protein